MKIIRTRLRISAQSPTQFVTWPNLWPYSLHGQVGGDTQLHLKLHPITSPDQPHIPDFLMYVEKTWEGLGTKLVKIDVLGQSLNIWKLQNWNHRSFNKLCYKIDMYLYSKLSLFLNAITYYIWNYAWCVLVYSLVRRLCLSCPLNFPWHEIKIRYAKGKGEPA